ncbi:MAG: hypothetical protein JSU70_03250 [Phycisphaerales bacterium]|nr:MAG: hypothetical protein JSU70_03250 [Phycisphaerales bacterium]
MKKLGYLLITVGFLTGALVAVLQELSVRWEWFITAFVAGAVGVLLVRSTERRISRSEGTLTSNMESIETALRRIVENLTKLNTEKESIDPYDVRHRIDELFADDIDVFVQGRESIAHAHSLSAYADVMSSFAAGERYLNRAWSASADGYVDEVNAYLDRARTQLAESLEKIRLLQSSPQVP